MAKLSIDVWSDVACPWCYVGKRRLEKALAGFEHRDDVELRWHAFELDPAAKKSAGQSLTHTELLSSKYGMSKPQAQARLDQMTAMAKEDGLELNFDSVKHGNTFDAHRLIDLADRHGKQDVMKERLLRAYFTDGQAVDERSVLLGLARDVGLPEEEVQHLLEDPEALADEVRADERQARELGISGVPFFVLDKKYALSGAQPAELFSRALAQAYSELAPQVENLTPEGAVCGPDGCE